MAAKKMAPKKGMSEKADRAYDKARGIVEGSKKDMAQDKKMGVKPSKSGPESHKR